MMETPKLKLHMSAEEELNDSTLFNESAEFRGDLDSSFGSDINSVSFQEISTVLRTKPDINIFYRTPCSGSSRFSRRSASARTPIDHVNKLPEHLLLRIFTYLNKPDLVRVMRTTHRFHQIAKDHTLWESMNLGNQHVDELSIHSLLDRRIKVLRMAETHIQQAPPLLFGYDFVNAPICRLTHLDLSQATFPNRQVLCNILSRCKNLEALSLENCELVDEEICREISKNSNLRYLDLVYVRTLSKNSLGGILFNCRNLKELNMAWAEVEEKAIEEVICKHLTPNILRLNLSGFREALNDQNVATLCKNCPNLLELDLSDNSGITENCLESILNLENLQVLTLSRCYGIEPIAFISFDSLQELNIYGCIGQEGVEMLRARLNPTLVNNTPICTIAKPTVGSSYTTIWGKKTRDIY